MSILLGVFLFCSGIHRAGIFAVAIPSVLLVSFFTLAKEKRLELGDKLVWIPLLGIVLLGIVNGYTWADRLFMCFMPIVYLSGVSLRNKAFSLAEVMVVLGVTSVIVTFALENGARTGGLFSSGDYNIATGVIGLCIVVSRKWWVYPIGIAGLCFTGAAEAVLVIIGLLLILLVNKQWKVLLWCMMIAGVVVMILAPMGMIDRVWSRSMSYGEDGLNGRVEQYREAINEASLLGEGYRPFGLNDSDIHNAPLLVLNQIGVFGMVLWLWVLGWGIFRSGAKRVWVIVGLMSIFDNFLWAQLGVWWWYFAGSTQKEVEQWQYTTE